MWHVCKLLLHTVWLWLHLLQDIYDLFTCDLLFQTFELGLHSLFILHTFTIVTFHYITLALCLYFRKYIVTFTALTFHIVWAGTVFVSMLAYLYMLMAVRPTSLLLWWAPMLLGMRAQFDFITQWGFCLS